MPEQRRTVRNPVARSPLMRKGGPHQKSRASERNQQRQDLEGEVEIWREEQLTEEEQEPDKFEPT